MKRKREGNLWIPVVLVGVLLVSGQPARSSDVSIAKGETTSKARSSDAPAPESAPAPETVVAPRGGDARFVNENIVINVSGHLFSVRLKDADIFDVMKTLSQRSGMRIRVDRDASKRITLSFRDMPIEKGIRNLIRPMSHAMVWKRGKDKNGKDVDILVELHIFREGHQGGGTVDFVPEEGPEEEVKPRVQKRRWTDEERARMLEKLRVKPSI